jgi:hypothetical protein
VKRNVERIGAIQDADLDEIQAEFVPVHNTQNNVFKTICGVRRSQCWERLPEGECRLPALLNDLVVEEGNGYGRRYGRNPTTERANPFPDANRCFLDPATPGVRHLVVFKPDEAEDDGKEDHGAIKNDRAASAANHALSLLIPGFDRLHPFEELIIVGAPIYSRMNPAVAVRAKRNHETWVVRTSIAQAANVVRLQIRSAIWPKKRRWCSASFAMTHASSDHVVADASAALNDRHRNNPPTRGQVRSLKSFILKLPQGRRHWLLVFEFFVHVLDRAKLEDYRLAVVAFPIRGRLIMMGFVDILPVKCQAHFSFAKQQEGAPVGRVIGDCCIASQHLHIANLAFAEVFKRAIRSTPISIAVGQSFFPSDDYHQLVLRWRYDPTLLLAAEPRVNVGTPVVDASALESPSHLRTISPSRLNKNRLAISTQVTRSAA